MQSLVSLMVSALLCEVCVVLGRRLLGAEKGSRAPSSFKLSYSYTLINII